MGLTKKVINKGFRNLFLKDMVVVMTYMLEIM